METDYLVVGAGAVAMAFVDGLIEDPDVDVIMLDRRPGPGGHWLDAYPFVRLHQPSANYGVNSTALGHDRIDHDGPNQGFQELAGGDEICGYFDGVMRHRLLPSGRVRFFPMSEYLGDRRFRSLLTGRESEVAVRRRIVDATVLASHVPATEPPPFEVDDDARCLPVGELVRVTDPPAGFVIIGAGKTAMDACTWLLEQGTPPEAITWIRPRDGWLMNRANFQPGPGAIETLRGVVHELEAVATSDSVDEVYDRLEQAGVMLRLDPAVRPTMAKGPTLSLAELQGLRRIENVVRLGHVRRIEGDHDRPRRRCRSRRAPVTSTSTARPPACPECRRARSSPTTRSPCSASPACTRRSPQPWPAILETTDRSTSEKNRLLPPNPYSDTPFDFLRAVIMGLHAEVRWAAEPDVQAWLDASRLNVVKDVASTDDHDELRDLQGRFLTAIFPALEKLRAFRAVAGPAEQELMFDPDLTDE